MDSDEIIRPHVAKKRLSDKQKHSEYDHNSHPTNSKRLSDGKPVKRVSMDIHRNHNLHHALLNHPDLRQRGLAERNTLRRVSTNANLMASKFHRRKRKRNIAKKGIKKFQGRKKTKRLSRRSSDLSEDETEDFEEVRFDDAEGLIIHVPDNYVSIKEYWEKTRKGRPFSASFNGGYVYSESIHPYEHPKKKKCAIL